MRVAVGGFAGREGLPGCLSLLSGAVGRQRRPVTLSIWAHEATHAFGPMRRRRRARNGPSGGRRRRRRQGGLGRPRGNQRDSPRRPSAGRRRPSRMTARSGRRAWGRSIITRLRGYPRAIGRWPGAASSQPGTSSLDSARRVRWLGRREGGGCREAVAAAAVGVGDHPDADVGCSLGVVVATAARRCPHR